ncbi:MAG TPA: bifunctional [glutamate--ammonia ligase]-adenylyl-L-tyrosine phosphorylase/[glutamate--ammonia-ligase] adenylyltransferase [Geobacterales bacterium]|nr:bifunctional [glutamate--ammonia ligase]-adenylyl-L-tyrosine phosphorylase/[glutamate--ammonia-ligase] adenylyltransferase [Geobacterales bacterium]
MMKRHDPTELVLSLAAVAEPTPEQLAALADSGFAYPARTAANITLLAGMVPTDTLSALVTASLVTPQPDMALNNLERVAGGLTSEEFHTLCANRRQLQQLLTICGSSPFLTSILTRDAEYLRSIFFQQGVTLRRSPNEMLLALRTLVPSGTSYHQLLPLLRRFKYAEILRIATRDLCGLAPLEEVTAELTALAAASLQLAYEVSFDQLAAEHGLPLEKTPHGERTAEMTILGMGKFGGEELNFSSDIDIICFYSSDQGETAGISGSSAPQAGKITLHAFFVKLAEMVSRAVSQVTEDGFVFRVDLGLRPEGKSGELALSQRSAEVYYEGWGQSWERCAMLKARPVAGSIELGERILKAIEPFIYRKYLDYTLIEDIMAMKKKIDASLAREREGEENIKLGRGGIREIEFFIQALQLVYAGKSPQLRERNSLRALQRLQEARVIQEGDCQSLAEAYRFLRTVEHRIQVVQERQTHSLPRKEEEYRALSRRCGFLRADGVERFSQLLEAHRQKVSAIYGDLFLARDERLRQEVQPEVYFFLDAKADQDLIKDMLAERRFASVESAYDNLVILRDGPPRAQLTERGRRLLERIAPLLLQEVFASPDPDLALVNLDRFLSAVGGRSSIYALLAENREILKLLVSLFGMSEFLSKIFLGHPELIDSLVSRGYAAPRKSLDEMQQELEQLIQQGEDFEERLDILRRFRHEEFLRIGMHDVNGELGQAEVTGQLSGLAESCLSAAFTMARLELSRFGQATWSDESGESLPADLAIIGMGKLGGGELNYHSDLDIIFIYDHQGNTDGEKQLTNHDYFARLAQKIISILTTTTREGYVYKIDTRLRPSGNAGPLVTSLDSFRSYHHEEAQLWERQALTKARVVLGGEELRQGIEAVMAQSVYGRGADDEARGEIHRLRMRMEVEIAKEGEGSFNIKTGRGGMVDVEFIVQFLQLRHGIDLPEVRQVSTVGAMQALHGAGVLSDNDYEVLLQGYTFLRHLENRLRLIHDYSINDLGGPKAYLDKLARRLGYEAKLRHPGNALLKDYEQVTEAVRGVYERVLGEGGAG